MPSRLRLRAVALIFSLTLLSGCASHYWSQLGADDHKFYTDEGDCLQRGYAQRPPFLIPWPNPNQVEDARADARNANVSGCLRTKGWRLLERAS